MHSPIKTINVAKLIKDACNLNILAYDDTSNTLSQKLIYIMLYVIDVDNLGEATHLFVSPAMVPELSEMAGYFKPSHICGLEIHYLKGLDRLDCDMKLYEQVGRHVKYFYSLGGSLAYGKENIVMVGTKEKVLLGCY
jgi:hypothetical protein